MEASRYPSTQGIGAPLGDQSELLPVPIPLDCTDGFNEAYFGRPEMLLNPEARRACSAWAFVDDAAIQRFENDLSRDIKFGRWDERFAHFRTEPLFLGSLKLIVGR
ncbi:hypothetical protein AAFX91_15395 [Bradyrhizobium sp. 31Argb]|uniref:hypothetical protein n=1 Tax=Bradyrhizobium sp. 31Argb TaxID=3141247 RepID=UPI003748A5DB